MIYERRFGPLNQFEVIVPIASNKGSTNPRETGVGDLALEYKRTLAHSLARGNIVSVTGEVVLPTGNEAKGPGRRHGRIRALPHVRSSAAAQQFPPGPGRRRHSAGKRS